MKFSRNSEELLPGFGFLRKLPFCSTKLKYEKKDKILPNIKKIILFSFVLKEFDFKTSLKKAGRESLR